MDFICNNWLAICILLMVIAKVLTNLKAKEEVVIFGVLDAVLNAVVPPRKKK
jgi:hypothetical protein